MKRPVITKEKKKLANQKYYQKYKNTLAHKWKNDPLRKDKLKKYYQLNKDSIIKTATLWNKANKEQRQLIITRNRINKTQGWIVNQHLISKTNE
jgi:hypothetical protein